MSKPKFRVVSNEKSFYDSLDDGFYYYRTMLNEDIKYESLMCVGVDMYSDIINMGFKEIAFDGERSVYTRFTF